MSRTTPGHFCFVPGVSALCVVIRVSLAIFLYFFGFCR